MKAFACDANTGSRFTASASFLAPAGITDLAGLEIVTDVIATSAPLPSWWDLAGPTGCRLNALLADGTMPGSAGACVDPWDGGTRFGGLAGIQQSTTGVRILVAWAVPAGSGRALVENAEYFATTISFDRRNTTGAGACAGCLVPMCLVTNSILLAQPVGTPGGDQLLTQPDTRNFAFWQSAALPFGCFVPTKTTTWSRVKGMYR